MGSFWGDRVWWGSHGSRRGSARVSARERGFIFLAAAGEAPTAPASSCGCSGCTAAAGLCPLTKPPKTSPKGPVPAVAVPGERGGCGAGPREGAGRQRRGREVTAAADVYVGQGEPAGARPCPGPGFRACGFSRLTGGQWAGARAGLGPAGVSDHPEVWRRLSWAGQTWASPRPRARAQGTLKAAGAVIPAAAGT